MSILLDCYFIAIGNVHTHTRGHLRGSSCFTTTARFGHNASMRRAERINEASIASALVTCMFGREHGAQQFGVCRMN
jgi:hypothetical protein